MKIVAVLWLCGTLAVVNDGDDNEEDGPGIEDKSFDCFPCSLFHVVHRLPFKYFST